MNMFAGNCRGCVNYKEDSKRTNDLVNNIVNDGKQYDDGIPVSIYFALFFFLIILGLIMGVFQ